MSGKDGTQEILIIRRGGGDDLTAAKGGAWKIAYADFVTAMMAFFLVMWLINSANEVTRARVASYFNPIKMTDASPAKKGLKEEVNPQSSAVHSDGQPAVGGSSKEKKEGKPVGETTVSEDTLLMNPYAMLDELVKQSDVQHKGGNTAENNAEQGDPFNPRSFEHLTELQVTNVGDGAPGKLPDKGSAVEEIGKKVGSGEVKSSTLENPSKENMGAGTTAHPGQDGLSAEKHIVVGEKAGGTSEAQLGAVNDGAADSPAAAGVGGEAKSQPAASHSQEDLKLAQDLRQEIEEKIAQFKGAIDLNAKVTLTNEGLLVVLEDGHGRSMFSVGSAQPNPALIEIIGDIGKLLSSTEGGVVIRGHTDGRQFRNRKYDNWQLSTDRAHMASYMLIRGGLAEARIKRIEGYGSSSPVVEGDLMSDANRRVEFLLAR